jgi:hypothetical protein
MSEHRSPYRSREVYCQIWPWCDCARDLDHDQLYRAVAEMADERLPAPTREQVEIMEVRVYVTLSCLSVKCPDVRVRRYATLELMKPFYDRQRAIDRQKGWM